MQKVGQPVAEDPTLTLISVFVDSAIVGSSLSVMLSVHTPTSIRATRQYLRSDTDPRGGVRKISKDKSVYYCQHVNKMKQQKTSQSQARKMYFTKATRYCVQTVSTWVVGKFTAFYGTLRFSIVFTGAHHCSVSCPNPNEYSSQASALFSLGSFSYYLAQSHSLKLVFMLSPFLRARQVRTKAVGNELKAINGRQRARSYRLHIQTRAIKLIVHANVGE